LIPESRTPEKTPSAGDRKSTKEGRFSEKKGRGGPNQKKSPSPGDDGDRVKSRIDENTRGRPAKTNHQTRLSRPKRTGRVPGSLRLRDGKRRAKGEGLEGGSYQRKRLNEEALRSQEDSAFWRAGLGGKRPPPLGKKPMEKGTKNGVEREGA